jgi:hypothetical protein
MKLAERTHIRIHAYTLRAMCNYGGFQALSVPDRANFAPWSENLIYLWKEVA